MKQLISTSNLSSPRTKKKNSAGGNVPHGGAGGSPGGSPGVIVKKNSAGGSFSQDIPAPQPEDLMSNGEIAKRFFHYGSDRTPEKVAKRERENFTGRSLVEEANKQIDSLNWYYK